MQDFLNLLFWAGTIAGGLLILLLLIAIFSGMEIGGDVDAGGGDMDAHAGADAGDASLGLLKTLLTFIAVGAFTARAIFLNTSWSWTVVTLTALVAGAAAVLLLTWFFRWLLKNQEEGTWHMWQAEGKVGRVYVPIPAGGKGRVIVQIDKVDREIAARSEGDRTIGTHEEVLVLEAKEDHVVVSPVAPAPE